MKTGRSVKSNNREVKITFWNGRVRKLVKSFFPKTNENVRILIKINHFRTLAINQIQNKLKNHIESLLSL